MKCPKCGGETDDKKNYCLNCGAELRPEDNSSDDTLRLPDLSGVPLGVSENRRRESGRPVRRSGGGLKATLIICALAIAAALAVCAALLLSERQTGTVPADLPEEEQTGRDEDEDGGIYVPDEEDEEEPDEQEEAPPKEPEPGENEVIAEEVEPEENDGEDAPAEGDGDAGAGEDEGTEEPEPSEPEPSEPETEGSQEPEAAPAAE